MSVEEMRDWLQTQESKDVGFFREGERESVGRQSAKKTLRMLEGGPIDAVHVRKVNGYSARHTAQRPAGGAEALRNTRWRYSLMNWGYDPLKRSL